MAASTICRGDARATLVSPVERLRALERSVGLRRRVLVERLRADIDELLEQADMDGSRDSQSLPEELACREKPAEQLDAARERLEARRGRVPRTSAVSMSARWLGASNGDAPLRVRPLLVLDDRRSEAAAPRAPCLPFRKKSLRSRP